MTSLPTPSAKPRVIFTMSTFMSHPGKLGEAIGAMTSLQRTILKRRGHDDTSVRVEKILVVNEYDPHHRDYASLVAASLPGAQFVQKGIDQVGQIASLNMILQAIKDFDYWVHWEESWLCHDNFLPDAVDIMQNTAITQLQVSTDIWYDAGSDRLIPGVTSTGARYAEVLPNNQFLALLPSLNIHSLNAIWHQTSLAAIWPLYSLRPSINRVSMHNTLGAYRPELPAIMFEWEYGMRWIAAGGKKGILLPVTATRQAGHVSTWAQKS